MTTMTESTVTTQVHQVFIRASAQAIWDAITKPEWSSRYGYAARVEYDLRPGGAYRALPGAEMAAVEGVPDVVVDGEVIEVDPPRKLVHSWRFLYDEEVKNEGPTRVTFEISEGEGGVTKLTLIHELEGAPQLSKLLAGELEDSGAGGGWAWVLSDLKSVLETGSGLAG